MLLDSGADINHVTKGHRPALAVAARKGHFAIVKLLIERGADVNFKGVRGSALTEAACKDHPDIVQMLLDNGADINLSCGNKDYSTALEAAAAKGTASMVSILLDRGADVNLVSTHGTALQAAVCGGRARMVTLLLDYGADINLVSGKGTALGVAVFRNKADILQLLIKRGADINIVGGVDGTALASATYEVSSAKVSGGPSDPNSPASLVWRLAPTNGRPLVHEHHSDNARPWRRYQQPRS